MFSYMKKEQRKRIVDRHRDSMTRFGYSSHALYWSNTKIQEIRFKVLADIGVKSGDSLLDVGCGFADFKGWFEKQGGALDYTGIDLSPDLLAEATKQHSDAVLIEGDLFDGAFSEQSIDWVILSGALNENLHDDGDYARRTVAKMYQLCRKGVAFNLLDARHFKSHDLQTHLPEEVLIWCRNLCSDSVLRDDYLDNDFTIYMRKQSAEGES
ncbi:MAG: class I SAM-dependent methyltransferase [Mariprofundaceae bacterium]